MPFRLRRLPQLPHDLLPEAVDLTTASERDQRHLTGLSRLEAHRGASRDIEAHTSSFISVEGEARVRLKEVIVRADLDRTVTGVSDSERHTLPAFVEGDLAVGPGHLAGYEFRAPRRAADGRVHGDELGAVGERRLDLDVVDHLRHALHQLVHG